VDRKAILQTLRRVCAPEPPDLKAGLGGEMFVTLDTGQLKPLVQALLDEHGVRHLSTITALNCDEGVAVLYHFWHHGGLTLRVHCPRGKFILPSLIDLIPGADWYEREVHDLFGVEFAGRDHLDPLLLPDDWDEPPPLLREEEVT